MLKVEIEKVDYEDRRLRSRKHPEVEFRVNLHSLGYFSSGPISRSQLVMLHQDIGKLLRCKKKPTYTPENKSSLVVSMETDGD